MKKNISDSELLVKLSAAVSYQFPNDRSTPSVLVSTLKNGKIYTSIVRYGDFKMVDYSGVKGKLVVCNATGNSLNEALKDLTRAFFYHIKANKRNLNPIEELANVFKDDSVQKTIDYCKENDRYTDFDQIVAEALEASYDGQ